MVGMDCVLLVLVLGACGLAVAWFGAERFGWLGCLLGFALGAAGGFAILYGVLQACAHLWKGRGGWFPPCHTGRCRKGAPLEKGGDYESTMVDGELVYRCKCGRDYVMLDGGSRFLERLPDGTLRPYMIHKPFRGWFPDREEE
jgi:hypothetical protein